MNDAQPLRAAAWMAGAISSFSLMAVAGRAVSLDHDTFEILFYRSIVSFLIVLAVGSATGAISQVSTRNLRLHLVRNLCHFTGQNLWFFALALIPLAQVIALEFTSPIWVALLAPLVLGERLTRRSALAALVGFAGVLIVVRPQVGGLSPAMLAAAASAIGFAGSALFTRKLTRDATITCIMFWLTLMQAVMGLICAGIDGDIAIPSAAALPWLALIGLTGLSAHFCLSSALALAPAGIVMPMDFLRLPVLAVIGLLVYGEPLDTLVILGAAVIFAANWMNLRPARLPQGVETARSGAK
ncbi:DMT family transporter [Tropicimonas sp. IMCC6043]|uniref:DMT family transporter n=1 Tax=Tropicimonas sp. IMCC6043 TaxID=2510645 RepID=UPI00101B9C53|nr:DMT family transporter [Tropicimonas sp. IMCC6043]RYH10312.1 DMT family transporter [Tropicimonas sp. IMCC6043]